MDLQTVMNILKEHGTEQIRKIWKNHGANDNIYGVKIGDLKKIISKYKLRRQNDLAKQLYATGNGDAIYLAGLIIDANAITADELRGWMEQAVYHSISEDTVAGVAAEGPYALQLGKEWIQHDNDLISAGGYATLAGYYMLTNDDDIDKEELMHMLTTIASTIHESGNRTRYTMNNFIISVGVSVEGMAEYCKEIAQQIGVVTVNMGNTSCKVPEAYSYIERTIVRNKGVKKRKAIRC